MSERVRVLLVDDDADLRRVVRRVLEDAGAFEVVGEAADGRAALELAADTDPHLVLLDLAMPEMGGLEALPALREAVPDAKVVVLSGYRGRRIKDAVLDGGAVGYLEKGMPARRLVGELMVLAGLMQAVEDVVEERTRGLDARPQSVGTARRFVEAVLAQERGADTLDRVKLVTSELVTNAIVHAGGPISISVRLGPEHIRLEVHDSGNGAVRRRDLSDGELQQGGRGLLLVDELAGAWGVATDDEGKTVWAEVPRFAVPEVVIE